MHRKPSVFVLLTAIVLAASAVVHAGDVDVQLTTTDGSTKFTIQNSNAVEVASVTSQGNAYINGVYATYNVSLGSATVRNFGTNANVCTDGSSNLTTSGCSNGTVTSVTGTSPINSSGGTTPAISLSQT